jgi:geranylgeranyl diphosphate synthase type II
MHPCRIGAVIATEGRVDPARFNRFGYFLGVAFQIQDDLLNLLGQRSRYGKEILGDLWEGKRTLMLVHLLQQCTEDERQRIGAFLGTERSAKTEEDVQWLNSLMLTYGSLDYARTAAVALADAAAQELPRAYAEAPPSDDLKFIEALVRYVVERDL